MTGAPAADVGEPLFAVACRHVLAYLHEHVPMGMWGVSRVENGRQTYLAVQDPSNQGQVGAWHEWESSFCVHMAAGTAPAVASDAQAVPLYAAAPVNDAKTIGSYAGAVISDIDGSLFGVICGTDPAVKGPDLARVEPLLVLLSRLLTTALIADRQANALTRLALQARLTADIDQLSGVYSRGAWGRLLEEEASFYAQLADPTAIVVIDLDGLKLTNDEQGHAAGDELIRRAAGAISLAVRGHDPVARLGGDEFGVLLRDCTAEAALERVVAIRHSLAEAGVHASLGVASAVPDSGLLGAQRQADQAMYEEKRIRRRERRSEPRYGVAGDVNGG